MDETQKILPLQVKVDLGVHYIPQSSRTVTTPLDGLVFYPGFLLGVVYPSAEMQLVYSTVPADWAVKGLKKWEEDV